MHFFIVAYGTIWFFFGGAVEIKFNKSSFFIPCLYSFVIKHLFISAFFLIYLCITCMSWLIHSLHYLVLFYFHLTGLFIYFSYLFKNVYMSVPRDGFAPFTMSRRSLNAFKHRCKLGQSKSLRPEAACVDHQSHAGTRTHSLHSTHAVISHKSCTWNRLSPKRLSVCVCFCQIQFVCLNEVKTVKYLHATSQEKKNCWTVWNNSWAHTQRKLTMRCVVWFSARRLDFFRQHHI